MKKVLFIIPILLLVGCGKKDFNLLENSLKEKASTYYETNIKGKIIMSGVQKNVQQKITLEALLKSGVTINEFTKEDCDLHESYALVIYSTDLTGHQEGDYSIKNNLVCKNYKTNK